MAAVTAGAVLLANGVANATVPPGTLGTDTLTPSTGDGTTAITSNTSAPCPTGTKAVNVTIVGPVGADGTAPDTATFPDTRQFPVTGTTSSSSAFSTRFPFSLRFSDTLLDDATVAGKPLMPGEYHVTLHCTDINGPAGQQFGTFTGGLIFDASLNYTVIPNASPSPTPVVTPSPSPTPVVTPSPSPTPRVTPSPSPTPAPKATTTTLDVIPNPGFLGIPEIFLVNVAPANANGTVQIKDGTTAIGPPVPVFGGFALLIDPLPKGTHMLTAVFTPTNPAAFKPSTSKTVSLTVNSLF
ncbi:MAG: Ig-like domain repeat protein [Pseudonocardiaceae bacterium]